MNFPVIEMFTSIQGEGKWTGSPSFFVRVSGCNLRCCFKGSICDTPYSSYNPEKTPYKSMRKWRKNGVEPKRQSVKTLEK